jgi:predicted ester cyclase
VSTPGLTVSPETAEANKALVRRWFAETDRGNLGIIDELLPEDYLDHNPPLPDLPPGREGVRRSIMLLRAAFTDVVHTIEDQIAEGDKVMTRLNTRARFVGECLGYQPTGELVEISGIAVHRVTDGRLVEHWAHMDMTGFMRQIGADVGDLG